MAIKRAPVGDAGLNENAINTNRSVEHLIELQGRQGSINYRKMSRGDGQVSMLLKAHKNPVRSCKWCIPKNDDADTNETLAVEILNDWVFRSAPLQFHTQLGQIISFLEYGFSVFELYWRPFYFKGGAWLTPILEQRMQTSIEDIWPDKEIVRQSTINKGVLEIPMKDLVFFIMDQQGEDLRGESVLRGAYRAWKDKCYFRQQKAIGVQRAAAGIPSMTIPAGVKVTDPDYIAARLLLRGIVSQEEAYMIVKDGWTFNVHDLKFDPQKLQAAIDAENTEMALSVLAQFVLLGQQGNTGAYALSRDQSDFFLDGIQYVINIIEFVYNMKVITPFLKMNFGDKVDPSRVMLRGMNLNKKAGQELANTLSAFKGGGFIKPTTDDEIMIRSSLDLPELTKEQIDIRRERENDDPLYDNNVNDQEAYPQEENTDEEDPTDEEKAKALKLAEPRVKERKEYIDSTTKEMTDFMKSNLLMIKDKLKADIQATLNRGSIEIQGLNTIDVSYSRYQKNLERKLAGIATEAWTEAKKKAKASGISVPVKLAEDMDPKDIKDKTMQKFVQNQALATAEQQALNMKNKAILVASNGPLKNLSVSQTMVNVDKIIDEFIDSNNLVVAGSLLVVGTSNFGANQFNREIEDQLWGYTFVGIDDENTSKICSFYHGKTYSVNGAELPMVTPPLHPNCRSYLEPIYRSQNKPAVIDDVIAPPSIQEQKSIY